MNATLRTVIEKLREIDARLQEQTRLTAGTELRGKVAPNGVDIENRRVRIVIGKTPEGEDVLSPWRPYAQTAGALKVHSIPSVGQTMVLRSESGDIEQGVAEPYFWSDDNPDPSDSADEHVLTFGGVRITIGESEVRVEVDGTEFVLSEAGLFVSGRLHTARGIHDQGGVFSTVGVWPPTSVFTPPIAGD